MGQLDWANSVTLDRGSREPIGEQLAAAIEARISTGLLSAGTRLPTTRDLASVLGINRGTVQAAYRRLADKGIVAGRVGSGTIVRPSSPSAAPFDPDGLLAKRAAHLVPESSSVPASPLLADFSRLTPDERFFPIEEFTRILAATWGRRRDLWQYAPPLGLEELRNEISVRLAEHGVHRSPAEILVTSGAQQGLDLLFRSFTDPGDVVAVEDPTYPGALALARFAGAEILPMPFGSDGPEAAPLLSRRVKLAYFMPERQNPTGVTTPADRRRLAVEACVRSGALILEDGYEDPDSGLEPLSALAPERTVWIGTLSKDLVPGFRIGWLAGPSAVIERVARVKKTADFQTPLPLQAAVAEFLRAGEDRRTRKSRAFEVEARRLTAERALRTHLPEVSWWGGTVGSALFWLHLPPGVSGRRVAEAAAARGVGVAPGQDFDPRGEDRENVRLSISRVDKRDIDRGIRALAEAVDAARRGSAAATALPVV